MESFKRPGPSGRQRKYYRITEEGRAWLAGQRQQFERLVAALDHLGLGSSGAGS